MIGFILSTKRQGLELWDPWTKISDTICDFFNIKLSKVLKKPKKASTETFKSFCQKMLI